MFYGQTAKTETLKMLVILFCVMAVAVLTSCSTMQPSGSMSHDNSMAALRKAEKKARLPKHPEELAKLRAKQQASEDGAVKPYGLVNAMAHRRAMLNSSSNLRKAAGISSSQWSFIGPGNIGGRIRSIAIHPTNTNTMWVGSVSGGIWTTTNGGSSWSPVNDFMGNLSISSIVIDPANSNIMYAGTGESFTTHTGAPRGYGVFKSTDGGNTWDHLSSTTPSADISSSSSAYNWYYVNRLAISSTGVILAATKGYYSSWGAIYRSADGGSTWTETFTGTVLDVRFDPNNPNNAVAASIEYNNSTQQYSSHLLRSTNAGLTWAKVKTFTNSSGRIELAYAPSDSQIIYASRDNESLTTDSGEIYKSSDSGLTWTYVSNPKHLASQGGYDNTIWVSPNDSNFVVIGGVELYRSTNGGLTWEQISVWWKWPDSAHADHHAIVHHPGFNGTSNKTVFFGNDGGIWKANDITSNPTIAEYDYYGKLNTSIAWANLNNSIGITQFYGAAGSSSSGKIIGGTQDNGHLMYTESTGASWRQTYGGDGGFAAVDPNDSNYMYGEYAYLEIYRSTDGGNNYTDICSGIIEANSTYCGGHDEALFVAPFILDPNNSNTLLAGAASLWRSSNVKAATPLWSSIKSPIGKDANGYSKYISAIAVARGNSDIIWAGYDSGELYHTSNGTAASPAWTLVSSTLPARYVMRIMIDKDNSNKVYVTFGGYEQDNLYVTTNGGIAWTNLNSSGTIPSAPIRTIVRHNSNSNWLYIGTEVGIYTSENGGASWSTTNDGPANVPVDELFWYGSDKLVAATYGRGMFMSTVSGNNCAASVSSGLVVNIPIITYSGSNYWLDLQYNSSDSTLTFAGADAVSDASSYGNCTASTLSSDFKLYIPVVMIGSASYWLNLEWTGDAFKITGSGQN